MQQSLGTGVDRCDHVGREQGDADGWEKNAVQEGGGDSVQWCGWKCDMRARGKTAKKSKHNQL